MASIFTRIASGEIPGTIVFQDDRCFAFKDIQAQAPHHLLVVPRQEIPSVNEATPQDEALLGHLFVVAAKIARQEGFASTGYRLVVNVGDHGGQTVDHLHVHVLGGRALSWPPG